LLEIFENISSVRFFLRHNVHDWLILQANGTRDPKIYVWDVELDMIQFFNFATGCDESDDVTRRPVSATAGGDADASAAERFYLLTVDVINIDAGNNDNTLYVNMYSCFKNKPVCLEHRGHED